MSMPIPMSYNRFKEIICIIFGHDWSSFYTRTDVPTGIVLERRQTCCNCNLTMIDESGYKQLDVNENNKLRLVK